MTSFCFCEIGAGGKPCVDRATCDVRRKPFDIRYAHVEPMQIKNRLCHNAAYGGPSTQVPGTCMIPHIKRPMKPEFFAALEENVRQHGFRNPILTYSTNEGLLLSFGGSRLRVAQKLGILVPSIVVDYNGLFVHDVRVDKSNWQEFFTDVPELFDFTDVGIDTHYSLERMRREFYDPAGMEWTHVDGVDTSFLDKEFPWL